MQIYARIMLSVHDGFDENAVNKIVYGASPKKEAIEYHE